MGEECPKRLPTTKQLGKFSDYPRYSHQIRAPFLHYPTIISSVKIQLSIDAQGQIATCYVLAYIISSASFHKNAHIVIDYYSMSP